MKRIIISTTFFVILLFNFTVLNAVRTGSSGNLIGRQDSLPLVLTKYHSDLIEGSLRHEAKLKFAEHQLPDNIKDWESYRIKLKNEIINKAGVQIDHKLPLNIREFGIIVMKGYTIKNIAFQTLQVSTLPQISLFLMVKVPSRLL